MQFLKLKQIEQAILVSMKTSSPQMYQKLVQEKALEEEVLDMAYRTEAEYQNTLAELEHRIISQTLPRDEEKTQTEKAESKARKWALMMAENLGEVPDWMPPLPKEGTEKYERWMELETEMTPPADRKDALRDLWMMEENENSQTV